MPSKIRKINKNSLNKQLILPLSFKSLKNRENYIISTSNESAVKLIENFNYWQKNTIPAAIIFGPKGSGKTHLSSIFRDNNNSIYLESLSSFNLDTIKKGNIFVIDNFFPCKFYPTELVMHFLNRVINFDGSILFLSRFSPYQMKWDLEDLNSRIRSIISSEINEPDDVLLYSFMVKYSNDKKLFLSDNHIFYIFERVERSFENIIKIIDKLDAYTLEIKERVNYKIIRTILER